MGNLTFHEGSRGNWGATSHTVVIHHQIETSITHPPQQLVSSLSISVQVILKVNRLCPDTPVSSCPREQAQETMQHTAVNVTPELTQLLCDSWWKNVLNVGTEP